MNVKAVKPILIVSALIILWVVFEVTSQPVVDINDLEVELVVDKDTCSLGESVTATVYLTNTRGRDVWLKETGGWLDGYSVNDPDKWAPISITPGRIDLRIPARTRVEYIERSFTPEYPGEFRIEFLGERVTVNVTP
jgi:uncharacterized protein (DUF58 family)